MRTAAGATACCKRAGGPTDSGGDRPRVRRASCGWDGCRVPRRRRRRNFGSDWVVVPQLVGGVKPSRRGRLRERIGKREKRGPAK